MVAVFGCSAVGIFAIVSAFIRGAGRVMDQHASGLTRRAHGGEAGDLSSEKSDRDDP